MSTESPIAKLGVVVADAMRIACVSIRRWLKIRTTRNRRDEMVVKDGTEKIGGDGDRAHANRRQPGINLTPTTDTPRGVGL